MLPNQDSLQATLSSPLPQMNGGERLGFSTRRAKSKMRNKASPLPTPVVNGGRERNSSLVPPHSVPGPQGQKDKQEGPLLPQPLCAVEVGMADQVLGRE